MFERFSRSWQLIKASASVLKQDKELLLFPLLSAFSALLVTAAFVAPILGFASIDGLSALREDDPVTNVVIGVVAFLFYLCQYFVVFFFNTALVGAAMIRLNGGDPTVADGLRIAFSRIGRILGYAAIAATVGVLLRMVQERLGMLGKWVVGLIGAAWNVATFMVVPILVTREVGPIDAVKESVVLLKRTWGENVIGQGGIGLVFGLLWLLAIVLGVGVVALATASGSVWVFGLCAGLMFVLLVGLALIQAALSGIYSAALYRHASDEGETPGFDSALLSSAFAPKR